MLAFMDQMNGVSATIIPTTIIVLVTKGSLLGFRILVTTYSQPANAIFFAMPLLQRQG
jgi:hypothetical protein